MVRIVSSIDIDIELIELLANQVADRFRSEKDRNDLYYLFRHIKGNREQEIQALQHLSHAVVLLRRSGVSNRTIRRVVEATLQNDGT